MEDFTEYYREEAREYIAYLEHQKKGSEADYTFFSAAQQARQSMLRNNLIPFRMEFGTLDYSEYQARTATVHAREDIVSITIIQLALLKRLDRNRNYLAAILILLIYVAVRLT